MVLHLVVIMKRLALIAAFIVALIAPASAQFKGGGGFGTAGFTSPAAAGGTTYAGPGDSKTFIIWGSVARVYNLAKASTSTSLADLVDASTGTVAICTLRGSTAGTVDLTGSYCTGSTTPAVACAAAAGGACRVSKLYDQVGTNPWVQATASKMPLLTFSGINGLPSMQFTSANAQILNSTSSVTQAQPATLEAVAERTANFTTTQQVIASVATEFDLFFNSAANQVATFNSPSLLTAPATDSAPHVLQICPNGASTTINVDGAGQVTGTVGTNGMGNNLNIGGFTTSLYLDGLISEAGAYAGTYNSGVQSNARTAYGL